MQDIYAIFYQTSPLGIAYHDNAHWARLGIVPTLDGPGDDPSEVYLILAGPLPALQEWLTAEYPDDVETMESAVVLDDDERIAYFAAVKEQHKKSADHRINSDLRWLMARMFEEFPEFKYEDGEDGDGPVSGADLVEFMSNQISNMPHLKQLKLKDPENSIEVVVQQLRPGEEEYLMHLTEKELSVVVERVTDAAGNVLDERIVSNVMHSSYAMESIADGWEGAEPDADGQRIEMYVLDLIELPARLVQAVLDKVRRDESLMEAQSLLDLLRLCPTDELSPEDKAFRLKLMPELPAKAKLEAEALRERSAKMRPIDF